MHSSAEEEEQELWSSSSDSSSTTDEKVDASRVKLDLDFVPSSSNASGCSVPATTNQETEETEEAEETEMEEGEEDNFEPSTATEEDEVEEDSISTEEEKSKCEYVVLDYVYVVLIALIIFFLSWLSLMLFLR